MMVTDAAPPLPDWHCHACDTHVAECSIGYSEPNGEPQCSRCGRFGFLEPLDAAEAAAADVARGRHAGGAPATNGTSPFISAEISAVALPLDIFSAVPRSFEREEDGFSLTIDGFDLPLRRERSPRSVHSVFGGRGLQRPEAQIFTFDLSRSDPPSDASGGDRTAQSTERPFVDVFRRYLESTIPLGFFEGAFNGPSESRGTWSPAIADLPRNVLSEVNVEGPCAICQEDFAVGDTVTSLAPEPTQCAHVFHSSCIIPWLSEHNSCPVCRFELPADSQEYERRKGELHRANQRRLAHQLQQDPQPREESTSSSSRRYSSVPSPSFNETVVHSFQATPSSPSSSSSSSAMPMRTSEDM